MRAERWDQIKALFTEAMEEPSAERANFIDAAVDFEPDVRDEVRSLVLAAAGDDSIPSARKAIASAATLTALKNALGGQYEIVQSLGHGGMGAVYLARDRALDRFVAIKVLRSDLADSSATRERFRREARIAAQLSHPNILPLFTFGEIGGLWYFITRYVRGVSLAERLRVEARIPVGETITILREVAEALEHAHRAGVVHRDIKPANILLDADTGHAVLADFGISKLDSETMTQSGAVIGTPSYMSPEQASESHDVDERSDIYSLGAVALEMLGGAELTAQTVDPAMKRLLPVIVRSMNHDPARRWPTAAAFRDALSRIAGVEEDAEGQVQLQLPTFAPYAFLWMAIWIVIAASPSRPLRDRVLLGLTALVVPLGFMIHIWSARSSAWPLSDVIRSAFRPPDWWGMWWPRRLRRKSDVWSRLPWPARGVRVILSAIIVAVPGIILARRWVTALAASSHWVDTAQTVLVLGAAATLVFGFAWALLRRVSPKDTVRLVLGATSFSSGWATPEMQRVLKTPSNGVAPPMSDTPAEYRRAIVAFASTVQSGQVEVAKSCVEMATKLADGLDVIDAELAAFGREASPAELNRLTAQLATLEMATSDEAQELAGLVRKQLDVVRRMQLRAELLQQERARMQGLLRGVWTRLSTHGADKLLPLEQVQHAMARAPTGPTS